MKTPIDADKIGLNTALAIQVSGTVIYFCVILGWGWSLSGSVWGTILLALIAFLFTFPILTMALPLVSMLIGALINMVAWLTNIIRCRHSRA